MTYDVAHTPELVLNYVAPGTLFAYANNARTHSKAQIRKIARSIEAFGFLNPILTDGSQTIIAGHGRLEAAKLLNLERVPVICIDQLTPDQVRAYVLADNVIATEAGWNDDMLRIELKHLVLNSVVDVSLTGFEVPQIDLIIGSSAKTDPDDSLPVLEEVITTQLADLWCLGRHRIFCGDARDASSFAPLMRDRLAAVVFANPPYNVVIDGHASGNGKVHHAEFQMASGEMSEKKFTEFLVAALTQLAKWSVDGAVQYICMDWRHMPELLAAGSEVYNKLLNVCVWAKDNGGMGSFYRSQHEMVFVFRNGQAQHRNYIQLGRFGRYRTKVWRYPGANSLSRQGNDGDLLSLHPTVKPIALVADALLDCSARGDVVLDSFLGSGSTLLAAERVGRVCYGIEIEPCYVDLCIRRWQEHTGQDAVHEETGLSFAKLNAQREESNGR